MEQLAVFDALLDDNDIIALGMIAVITHGIGRLIELIR